MAGQLKYWEKRGGEETFAKTGSGSQHFSLTHTLNPAVYDFCMDRSGFCPKERQIYIYFMGKRERGGELQEGGGGVGRGEK